MAVAAVVVVAADTAAAVAVVTASHAGNLKLQINGDTLMKRLRQ